MGQGTFSMGQQRGAQPDQALLGMTPSVPSSTNFLHQATQATGWPHSP